MDASDLEKFLPIKKAAAEEDQPYWKVLRAVNRGALPSYTFQNSRRLIRRIDIRKAIIDSAQAQPIQCDRDETRPTNKANERDVTCPQDSALESSPNLSTKKRAKEAQ